MAGPTIPRSALTAGIVRCLEVAGWRLREASSLLQSAPHTAAILFSFGAEEFGKAALLYEAFQAGDDPVTINGFYDHKAKLTAAGRYIRPSLLLLSNGGFDADAFDAGAFEVGQKADAPARFSSLYVDWNGEWSQGSAVIDRETLGKNITSVSEIVLANRQPWTSGAGT
jgi:AbiV family abortive infection protein